MKSSQYTQYLYILLFLISFNSQENLSICVGRTRSLNFRANTIMLLYELDMKAAVLL